MIKNIRERNTLRKYMLMVTCLILFIAGGYRAFNLYKTYKSYNQEIASIERHSDNQMHTILRAILSEGKESIAYSTKTDAITLHRLMTESMSMDEIYNNIVNMNLGDKLIDILDEVFNLQNSQENIIVTVGNKDYVFYSKSNIDLDKYKYLSTNGKQYLTWDEYYEQLEDTSGVLHQAYEDISLNRVEYAIIRTDGYYPDNRYYTIEDVIQDYHNNGTKNLDKYLIITLGVITDDGDIFGEKDNDYLNMNTKVNKIYIFKSVSIGTFIKNYNDLIKSCDESMSARIIQYRNSTEFSNALINIFLITSSIITIMIVIKSLDDENIEINNLDIVSKEENSEEKSD
jgi:hypothetical protein